MAQIPHQHLGQLACTARKGNHVVGAAREAHFTCIRIGLGHQPDDDRTARQTLTHARNRITRVLAGHGGIDQQYIDVSQFIQRLECLVEIIGEMDDDAGRAQHGAQPQLAAHVGFHQQQLQTLQPVASRMVFFRRRLAR